MTTRFITIEKFIKMSGLPIKTIRLALKAGQLIGVPFRKRILIDTQSFDKDCAALVSRTVSTPGVSELHPGGLKASLKIHHQEIRILKSRT